jgi:hypothetical protein
MFCPPEWIRWSNCGNCLQPDVSLLTRELVQLEDRFEVLNDFVDLLRNLPEAQSSL